MEIALPTFGQVSGMKRFEPPPVEEKEKVEKENRREGERRIGI